MAPDAGPARNLGCDSLLSLGLTTMAFKHKPKNSELGMLTTQPLRHAMFRHADLIIQNIMNQQCHRIMLHLVAETGATAHYSTSFTRLLMPGIP